MTNEFWIAFTIYGGIIGMGLLIALALTLVGLGIKNRLTRKTITKELYEKKERENGQYKSGARGKF